METHSLRRVGKKSVYGMQIPQHTSEPSLGIRVRSIVSHFPRMETHSLRRVRTALLNCGMLTPENTDAPSLGIRVGLDTSRFPPDGNTIASGGGDGTVRLWDAYTGRYIKTFTGHTSGVNSVAFSPDGNTIASLGSSIIRIWDANTGQHIRTLMHSGQVDDISFSPDGNTIASANSREIHLWDTNTGRRIRTLTGYTDWVWSVSFSPDGQMLASASGDKTVHLWDANTGQHLQTLTGHTDSVYSVSFSPDGDTLASGSRDSTIRLWDANTGRHIRTLPGHTSNVSSVAFSPDGDTLASGSADSTIRLWDTNTGTQIRTFTGHAGWVSSVTFSPDGNTLASADGTGLLWELAPTSPEPQKIAEDVNADGTVNIIDLTLVASNFGKTGHNSADVNSDGVVNIIDLTLVAGAFGNTAAAPALWRRDQEIAPTRDQIQQWLNQARQMNLTDPAFQRGILILEQLLASLIPKETALLPNYPNPFNPETWIPYQLAKPADISISIYTVDGTLIRTLDLGHQSVGMYESRSRAAYWDGRNALGESVASGVYFYTLTAGNFAQTRRMLILK